jgi:copper(I)-binding protein
MRCGMRRREMRNAMVLGALIVSVAMPVSAQVTAQDAWVRGTVPGQDTTAAYMTLRSASDATLTAAKSSVAKLVELHSMSMDGTIMRMRGVPRLALPAGTSVELAPSGYHLMMMGLAGPLRPGQSVPITLTFEDAKGRTSQVQVKAVVRPIAASGEPSGHAHDMSAHPK